MKYKDIIILCSILLMVGEVDPSVRKFQPTYINSYVNGNGGFGYRSPLNGNNASAYSVTANANNVAASAGTSSGTVASAISRAGIDLKGHKPCNSRKIPGQSVVCVCNTTYCDQIVRVAPSQGQYVTYTSSEAGSRFVRTIRNLRPKDLYNEGDAASFVLDPSCKYQTVEGFGGAVTDAAAMNWLNLTDVRLKNALINSYYSKLGLEYNMLRVPIGGSDFSTHAYAYNEHPRGDLTLSNFSLAYEDHHYKIPMIKAIMKAAEELIHVVASAWSPPLWMKTEEEWGHKSELLEECYQAYADYHVKFVEEYKANGIPIWGITTTNEPINGMIDFVEFNSLGWSPLKQGKWIAENLGPTIRNSSFSDLKILALDDQRATLPWWFNVMTFMVPEAFQYIDGVAFHFYFDKVIHPKILSLVYDNYPEKFLLSTEACEGVTDSEKVLLGSWDRAKSYITDIIEDLNHNFVGWIDWNLCLNRQGGPNWVENFVDSPIIVFPEKKEFVKQPMFYALGHFSKFLPRGSQRIKVTQKTSSKLAPVDNVAFVTPRNTVVMILYNDGGPRNVFIQLGNQTAIVPMESRSIVTVEIALKQR